VVLSQVVLFQRDAADSVAQGAPSRVRARPQASSLGVVSGALFFSALEAFRPLRGLTLLCALASLLSTVGCGVIKKKPEESADQYSIIGKDIPPDKAKQVLSEVGGNFAYGPGLGDAAVNVGTVVVFPPYAIYLLGNAVLSISGYEPVTVASMLPEEQGKQWSQTYDHIVSGPGKMVAAVSGHEYRSREVGDQRLKAVIDDINNPDGGSATKSVEAVALPAGQQGI